jgi:hypothetical protein
VGGYQESHPGDDRQFRWSQRPRSLCRYVQRRSSLGGCRTHELGVTHIRGSSILLTLATLTTHTIINIFTSPSLLPAAETLNVTLAARHVFLDYAFGEYWKRNKYRIGPMDDRALTAHTGGWAGVGQDGMIAVVFQ